MTSASGSTSRPYEAKPANAGRRSVTAACLNTGERSRIFKFLPYGT